VPIRYPANAATTVDRIDAYVDPRPAIIGTRPRRVATHATRIPVAMSQTTRMRALRSSQAHESRLR
jgi:hypothetical protein